MGRHPDSPNGHNGKKALNGNGNGHASNGDGHHNGYPEAPPMDPGRMYFYTDGCLIGKYGSWSVVGVKYDPEAEKWKSVFSASDEDVPAKDSTQMELHAIRVAIRTALDAYPGTRACVRTDHQGLKKAIGGYLRSYSSNFRGADEEVRTNKVRQDTRKRYKSYDYADEYDNLFNMLDQIGQHAAHHEQQFSIEWLPRESDSWIRRADRDARSANPTSRMP